jgi:hypothetical protein
LKELFDGSPFRTTFRRFTFIVVSIQPSSWTLSFTADSMLRETLVLGLRKERSEPQLMNSMTCLTSGLTVNISLALLPLSLSVPSLKAYADRIGALSAMSAPAKSGDFTGTYKMEEGGPEGVVLVQQTANGRIKFYINATYGTNTGGLSGEVPLTG